MEEDFEDFLRLLLTATGRLEPHYFLFRVAGREDAIYRERVYCYELYHRIRECMPDGYQYVLDGEVDKAAHPFILEQLGALKPDFIVHVPGTMDRNLTAVEVKSINARAQDIREDMGNLRSFIQYAGYLKAISLIYGEGSDRVFEKFRRIKMEICRDLPDRTVFLLWHRRSGREAEIVMT